MKLNNSKRNAMRVVAAVSLGVLCGAASASDDFPTKPIRIIVPAAPGGALDGTSRLVAVKMGEKLGVQVIIDNRPGADTMLGTRLAREAPADGYTILGQAPSFTLLPYIKKNPGFNPLKDFTGLGMMLTAPMILEVNVESPDQSVADLVARAKTKSLSYGTGGPGTPAEVVASQFMRVAGLTGHVEIPFKGAGPTLSELAANRLDFTFDLYTSSRGFIEGGKFRPLAVTSPARMPILPNVPTFQELGYNYTYKNWLGLMVPAGTPKIAIQRLSEALKYALASKEIVDRWRTDGGDGTFLSPEEMNAFLKGEYDKNAKMAADMKYEKQ